jgi:DNA polymerase-1
MTETLVAVDGTNLLYRSYHALAGSGLSYAGRPVWAVHGLLMQLAKVVEAESPSHLVVAFDTPGGCPARLAIDPGYKATRTTPAESLAVQLSWAPSVLRQTGFCVVEHADWEADDLLASAVRAARDLGMPSVVVTSDRDAYQLVGDDCRVRTPDDRIVDEASLRETYGVDGRAYRVLAALRGEPSDNLPGVSGVGAKTAARLAAEFGSMEAIAAASDAELRKVVGPKVLAALRAELPLAQRSLRVAELRSDLAVDLECAALSSLEPSTARRRLREVGLEKASDRVFAVLGGRAASPF